MTDAQDRHAAMLDATRLTGQGRLDEATALIQRHLGLRAPTTATADGPRRLDPPTIDGVARRLDEAGPSAAAIVPERVREVVGSVVRGLREVAPALKGLTDGLAGGLTGLARGPGRGPDEGLPGRFLAERFGNAAGARDYKLYVPSRPQRPPALVVMLHGCTQSPDDFAAGTGMNALAERDGFLVAYPAQSRSANGQKCWNWFEPRDQGREGGEPAIVAGITRAVMAAHGVDPSRVYLAGMSAGGAAAANIARAYPDLYAAVGVHSGLAAGCARDLSSALLAMRSGAPGGAEPTGFGAARAGTGVPTIVFHGEDDGTVAARNADHVLAQAGAGGLDPRSEAVPGPHPATRTQYRDARGVVRVESWRVRGSGHAWSGGDPSGSYTDPAGPDASRAMLDFFALHRLRPVQG